MFLVIYPSLLTLSLSLLVNPAQFCSRKLRRAHPNSAQLKTRLVGGFMNEI